MTIISISRTITERVRVDSAELADTLGIDEERLLAAPDGLAGYIEDYCQDGDDAIFEGAHISSGGITAEVLSDEPVTRCVYCDEGIGIIHYGDGDRWQPTPALGDDFCENRWDEAPDKPAMYCEESIARESGEFCHSPTEV